MSNKKKIEPKLEKRFDHVYWSIVLFNSSFSELRAISEQTYNASELTIVNSYTFNFYRMSLQYCAVMEYNKLLEEGRKDKNQNTSSLFQLNDVILLENKKSFSQKYIENKAHLISLKDSSFYDKMRTLRDKKIAHSDNHQINLPFDIKRFESKDISDGINHLQRMKVVLKNCAAISNIMYDIQIPYRNDETENFIKFQAEYKDYYFKNFKPALTEKFSKKCNK